MLSYIVPPEVDRQLMAGFKDCEAVPLKPGNNLFTWTGNTPSSHGSGKKDVTLMSADGSWRGDGKTSFEFVDLQQEVITQIVKNRELQHKFFDLADKGLGNKPADVQTSDPSGVTGAGTDDKQVLKDWKPTSCPESDDNESDYFADDETSSCSSPSHREMFDSEPEDCSQNSKDIARIVAEKLCNTIQNVEFQLTREFEATTSKEEHFEEASKVKSVEELSKELSFEKYDREKMDWEGEDGSVSHMKQIEENIDHLNKSDISSPTKKEKVVTKQDSSGERFPDCRSENTPLDEPDEMINATSLPDDIKKHVHLWLKCAREEESVVSIDMWDFAGQHLYYASHPAFLSSRAVYLLVHNLSKPLNAPAQLCVGQGTHDVKLENPNDETNIENLLSWLATIHSLKQVNEETDDSAQRKLPYLRPPVFIVLTRVDKPVEDIAVVKKKIQERISGKECEMHVVRPFFSIVNTARSLRSGIKRFCRQDPQFTEHIAGTGKVLDYPTPV
ncbi:hypothetical protein OS493_020004 [Desmophyllum pertusum]|uniref:Uncharacterized protein n=1 Tax=Desmophyllum pertusum TaxID=174260 RepID=A0A9W9YEU2_9CNID|nr:hypothetical protein OS493_020004 [Desmophyllum pertusum]